MYRSRTGSVLFVACAVSLVVGIALVLSGSQILGLPLAFVGVLGAMAVNWRYAERDEQ